MKFCMRTTPSFSQKMQPACKKYCGKYRKPTVRFGSIRFRHEPVPVPTVPVPKSDSAGSGSGISADSEASPPKTETSRGLFFGPKHPGGYFLDPKNRPIPTPARPGPKHPGGYCCWTETFRGVFFGPEKQPKNAPPTPKTKNVQNSYK